MGADSARPREAEVVVIGAGIVGLVNALLYAKRGFKVALIDDVRGQRRSYKVGESLLIFSNVFLRIVAELDEFNAGSFHKEGLWMALGMEGKASFDEASEWALAGPIPDRWRAAIPNQTLFRCLYREAQIVRPEAEEQAREAARRHPNITFLDAMRVEQVEIREDEAPHRVRWRAPASGEVGEIAARWVIDASGRRRLLATARGHAGAWDDGFQTTALWAQFEGVDEAAFGEAWVHRHGDGDRLARHFTTVHLWGDGYWIWVIRLAGDRVSVGVTHDTRRPLPGATPQEQFWNVLDRYPVLRGALRRESMLEFRMYRKVQYWTDTFISPHRYVITGDAATLVDPYYSQGLSMAMLTAWHAANVAERELRGEGLDAAYLERINRCTRADWEMLRNMVIEKYSDALQDPRFFVLSHMLDSLVVGPVYTWRRYLIRWVVETGGDTRRETPALRAMRERCQERLFYSHSTPWWFLPPELLQRIQLAVQRGLAARARWRLAHGIRLPAVKFVRRPDSPYAPLARLPFFTATRADAPRMVDLSPERTIEPPEARLTGEEPITLGTFKHYASMLRLIGRLVALDWAETAYYKLRAGLELPLAPRGGARS